jgi:hypothetical protein
MILSVGGPDEGLGLFVMLAEEPIDSGLQIGDGSKYAAL